MDRRVDAASDVGAPAYEIKDHKNLNICNNLLHFQQITSEWKYVFSEFCCLRYKGLEL